MSDSDSDHEDSEQIALGEALHLEALKLDADSAAAGASQHDLDTPHERMTTGNLIALPSRERPDLPTSAMADPDSPSAGGPSAAAAAAAPAAAPASSASPSEGRRRKQERTGPGDFMFGHTLGEGSFARVVHARLKSTGQEFAIKIMEKHHIMREKKVKYVLMEKDVLSRMKHDRIVRLWMTFKDTSYLYMVMELAHGGELLHVINSFRDEKAAAGQADAACDPALARFYAAETVQALEHIHGHGIVHRDLKPENILVDRHGHLKITDFGTALREESDGRHNSFVGTAEYVSPEVLRNEPATIAVDLWALGCLIFQLLSGRPPFQSGSEYLTFQTILNHCDGSEPLQYPPSVQGAARALVAGLLREDPRQRVGAGAYFGALSAQQLQEWEESCREGSDGAARPQEMQEMQEMQETQEMQEMQEGRQGGAAGANDYGALKGHAFWEGSVEWEAIGDPPFVPVAKEFAALEDMMDGALDDWQFDGEATPIQLRQLVPQGSGGDGDGGEWSQFLDGEERLVYRSFVWKRKGLFSKHRVLLLCEGGPMPRLVYVDPITMKQKGTIPWTDACPVEVETLNDYYFNIFCSATGRRYHFKDEQEGGAVRWQQAVEGALLRRQSG